MGSKKLFLPLVLLLAAALLAGCGYLPVLLDPGQPTTGAGGGAEATGAVTPDAGSSDAATPESSSDPATPAEGAATTAPGGADTPAATQDAGQGGAPAEAPGLEGRTWRLVSFGKAGEETAVPAEVEVTAAFSRAAKQVAGRAGCNRYFASYETEGANLTVGPVGATRMACDDALMKVETSFFQLLETARSFSATADGLEITYEGGVATFAAVP